MTKKNKLFEDFPPTSTDTWKEKIKSDLKRLGIEYKDLIWNTGEGFDLQPFYRKEDLPKSQFFIPPKKNKSWLIAQKILVKNPRTTNKKAKKLLNSGVNELHFKLNGDENEFELETILQDLVFNNIILHTPTPHNTLSHWIKIAKKHPIPPSQITGGIYAAFELSPELTFHLINFSKEFSNLKLIHIENKSNSIVKELSYCLLWALEYLDYLTDKGFKINEIANRFCFKLYIGSNYFLEIAKIRAFRILWIHLLSAYIYDFKVYKNIKILAETKISNLTDDKHNNMLRTQTQAMSAIIGGVDSLLVQSYDLGTSEFAERIARNQQLLLKEEAHFDKTKNPVDGSYYVELITYKLVKKAWNEFLKLVDKA